MHRTDMFVVTVPHACHRLRVFVQAICFVVLIAVPGWCGPPIFSRLDHLVGPQDAVLLTGSQGEIVFEKHARKALIPASILKIPTAWAALNTLGDTYRYPTEFYVDPDGNLKIKGYGDPLLISEVIEHIAKNLADKRRSFGDLILDDTFFGSPLVIPGISDSDNPYDAPNGALCVNFNTIYFEKAADGTLKSAEPQTPLLPFAKDILRRSRAAAGRIPIPHQDGLPARYAGRLFVYFFKRAGIAVSGNIRLGKVDTNQDRLLYRHESPFTLTQVVSRLMEFSNNFMANQLLITVGATRFGAPGSIQKGAAAAKEFLSQRDIGNGIHLVEGSGISRKNRVTAAAMANALSGFAPYRHLLTRHRAEWFKTGSLSGIRTRAGYIEPQGGRRHRFVVLLNTPRKTTAPVMNLLHRLVQKHP